MMCIMKDVKHRHFITILTLWRWLFKHYMVYGLDNGVRTAGLILHSLFFFIAFLVGWTIDVLN